MRRLLGSVGLLVALAIIAMGCGTEKSPTGGAKTSTGGDNVALTQGGNLTFAMVTHSDEGSFWSVVKKGAQQAAKDEGVKLVWSPSNNDPQKQAQLIDAAPGRRLLVEAQRVHAAHYLEAQIRVQRQLRLEQ